MAGQFEIFTDAESNVRFRLLGADGTVLAVSKAFQDKRAAADGIMAVRECAGTGLIRESHATPWGAARTRGSQPAQQHSHRRRHLPAV
ncbi:MAG: DUF1508 domain-containing protein [Arthrobacter sp.]|jgi:uncharacterized protein YegP (UPF0339 family)|nr:DUF1508 domain-containing protein [Arthrobacter sp.]